MKQTYPLNRGNQSVGNKLQPFFGTTESGPLQHFYRSVILAVSGSLLCVAAGESAAGQSSDVASQTLSPGLMLAERAESAPPRASFGALNMMEDVEFPQWPTPPLNPNAPTTPPESNPTPPQTASTNVIDQAVPAAPAASSTDADANSNPNGALPEMPLVAPKVYPQEVDASGDFMYGTGTITVPVGYAFSGAQKSALTADRSTVYYGGTISYSPDRIWFIDFSGENGRSTGSSSLEFPTVGGIAFPASFDVNDTLYQVYLRYNLQNFLAGTRFRAYLRGGVSLVQATLTTVNQQFTFGQGYAAGQLYRQNDNTFDVLGNFGFGLTYSIHSTPGFKAGLKLEGEGFGGNRSQDITETFVPHNQAGPSTAKIDNTVYGVIGRLTLHAEYTLAVRWKLTGDVGIMTKNSWVSYPDFGTRTELLYGPYAKVGASFVF